MASPFNPLFFKSDISLAPPIQHKAGLLFELLKGKGQRCGLTAYRDVMVCNAATNPRCKLLRTEAMKPLTGVASSTQFGGGLNGGSTDFPRLYLDAARTVAQKHKLYFARIYLDLKSAFASIIRGLALQHLLSVDDLCSRLAQQGFDKDDVASIVHGLQDFDFWQESGRSEHLAALLARIHRCSWFAVEGVLGCYQSHRGVLAGTSLGDLVFLLAFSRVLLAVETRLKDAGVLFELPCVTVAKRLRIVEPQRGEQTGSTTLTPVAYVDDVAQPLIGTDSDIVPMVRKSIAIYHETFAKFLLTINYAPGKT